MNAILRNVLPLLAIASLGACRLQVMVPTGGEVQSVGSGTCLTETVCVFEIEDNTFNESFTAVPIDGWDFLRWNSGGDFLCADSTNPTCTLNNSLLTGIPAIDAIIASTQSFYIQPVFQQRNDPVTDFITVGAYEIAQPDLFTNVMWWEVSAACPVSNGGICDGILKGYDLTGWTWMNFQIMNEVFNTYGVTPALPVTPPNNTGTTAMNSSWAPAFFNAGWRPTYSLSGPDATALEGWIRDETLPPLSFGNGYIGFMIDYDSAVENDRATTDLNRFKSYQDPMVGAWLYRMAP